MALLRHTSSLPESRRPVRTPSLLPNHDASVFKMVGPEVFLYQLHDLEFLLEFMLV